jgi:hypothetical protein
VLFVRFTTDDGQKLTADMPIVVDLPGTDAPGQDRQTKRPAKQARRDGEPQSRAKQPEPRNEPTRTARHSDRPEWKPYR